MRADAIHIRMLQKDLLLENATARLTSKVPTAKNAKMAFLISLMRIQMDVNVSVVIVFATHFYII